MLGCADQLALVGERPRRRPALLEQPGAEFHAQDARHRVIDARHRNLFRAHLFERVGDEALPVVRHHDDVDAGVDRLGALVLRAALHFVDAVPVADDDAVELHALLQQVGEQSLLAMHLPPVPAVVRRHDCLHARFERGEVALSVELQQLGLGAARVAAVDAVRRATVADEVLRRREHVRRVEKLA
jgi:hypothetical protein